MENQTIIENTNQLAVYNPHRAELEALKKANETIVFNYDTTAGEKEARSHIYKLRLSKTAVDKVRETEKKASLEYGRKVDAQAKEIIAELDAMIEVHAKPIKEKEERNKKRITAIQERIGHIAGFADCRNQTIENLEVAIAYVQGLAVDETLEEFMAEALNQKNAVLKTLQEELAIATKREMERQELECLRREAVEREAAAREAKLVAEAEARATAAAEAKAAQERAEAEAKVEAERKALEQRAAVERAEAERGAHAERLAAEKREREAIEAKEAAERMAIADKAAFEKGAEDARLAIEQHEREIAAAKEKADREIAEAEERARQKLAAEAEAKRIEDNHRAQQHAYIEKIHGEISSALAPLGADNVLADLIIAAIRAGEIPHVKIIY